MNGLQNSHSYRGEGRISLRFFVVIFVLIISASSLLADKVYQQPASFVKTQFGGKTPAAKVQSLSAAMQKRIAAINGRKYSASRVRYWSQGGKSVYILSDIGKSRPITIGYVVENGKISQVKVLVYRESHGNEVAYSYFTKQFKKISLKSNGRLSKSPRNIAGATLSVRALTRMARVALYLDSKK